MRYRKIHVFARGGYLGTVHNSTLEEIQRELGHCHTTESSVPGVLTIEFYAVQKAKPKPQPADYVSFSSLRRSADYVPC